MSKFTRLAARYIVAGEQTHTGSRAVCDIEANGFLDSATTVHCIVIADLDSDRIDEYGPDQIQAGLEHLSRFDYLAGHNICGYDLPLLRRLHDWAPPQDCTVIDTLIAGRLILPNLPDLDDQAVAMGDPALGKLRGHYSIEAWGARLGIGKVGTDIEDWSRWTPKMQQRCAGDGAICKALWHFLKPDSYSRQALTLEHAVAAICDRIRADGVPFDVAAAEQLRRQWTKRRSALAAQLFQQFPGTNLNSRPQIGALPEARGWIPENRTEKTGQPKIDDDLLEAIPSLYPEFAGLAEHYLLGRRLGQLSNGARAWCKNVGADGRIHGGLVHIGTPHSRAKHLEPNLAQVPNPKKGKPFATECRALFRANNGWVFVTCDQASLQDRGYAHYLHAFDGGAYAQAFLNGADTHWQSAITLGLIPPGTARNKESRLHTALREGAKTFRYAFLYGCGTARAGRIIADVVHSAHQIDATSDLPQRFFGKLAHPNEATLERIGKHALERFEAGTPGLGRLRQQLRAHAQQHGWLPGLDGRRVPVRALYSALNFIVTSSEAIICKRWLVRAHDELCARFRYGWDGDVVIVLWIHDELVACCRPEIGNQVGEILVRHAKEPAEFYGFRVPLAAEYKIGRSWAGEPLEAGAIAGSDTPELVPAAAEDSDDLPECDEVPQPIASTDLGEINIGLQRKDIEAITISMATNSAATPGPLPWEDHAAHSGNGSAGNGFDTSNQLGDSGHATEQPESNAESHGSRGNYGDNTSEKHSGKPYTDAHLLKQGYRLTNTFPYELPDGSKLYEERRYELRAGITPTKQHPRKTCRFCHVADGILCFDTGPRRILFNWPAIMRAGPQAVVHITEGAYKSAALNAAGLLATAVAYHKWEPECVSALAGRHLIYHEDFDVDDEKGHNKGREFSADARQKLTPVAASFRIVPVAHLFRTLGREPWPTADVKDWLEAGGDTATLLKICERVPAEAAEIIEPFDLWGQFDPPALPTGMLPEVIEHFAFEEGELTGADPSGFALAGLTVCAAALSDAVKLQVKRHDPHWLESARLWAGLIGNPSTKKSPIILRTAKPLKRIDADMWREFLAARECYDALSKEERKAVPPPKQKRLRLEDTTIEAAQEVLKDSPDGVLCIQDELGGWFGAMDKYSGRGAMKDRGFWLQAFHGGPYAINRIARGAAMIENLSISLLGGIQPDPIRKIAEDSSDDGLLQRLIPVVLRRASIGKDAPSGNAGREYDELVMRLHDCGHPGGTLQFDDASLAIRGQLEQKHLDLMAYEAVSRRLAAHIGKYDGLFARLCLLWHYIDGIEGLTVTERTAQRVADFMHQFLLPHATSFYAGMLALSDDHEQLTGVAGYILAKQLTRITSRDFQRGSRSMRRLGRQEIESVFTQLEALGWLLPVSGSRWVVPLHREVNPEVHRRFRERAARETTERKREREMLQEMFGRKKEDR